MRFPIFIQRIALVIGFALASCAGGNTPAFAASTPGNQPSNPQYVKGSNADGTLPISGTITATSTPTTVAPAQSTALESNHVLKSSAGTLYSVVVNVGSTAGYLMLFNATSAPADGAVTPYSCYGPLTTSSPTSFDFTGAPATFTTGMTVVFSTTGCLNKTASATVSFNWQVK